MMFSFFTSTWGALESESSLDFKVAKLSIWFGPSVIIGSSPLIIFRAVDSSMNVTVGDTISSFECDRGHGRTRNLIPPKFTPCRIICFG